MLINMKKDLHADPLFQEGDRKVVNALRIRRNFPLKYVSGIQVKPNDFDKYTK